VVRAGQCRRGPRDRGARARAPRMRADRGITTGSLSAASCAGERGIVRIHQFSGEPRCFLTEQQLVAEPAPGSWSIQPCR
jgi:hypothetical protein